MFCEQVDTQLRATMYSLSRTEIQDATCAMESMRRAVKTFRGQTTHLLSEAIQKDKAAIQKARVQQQQTAQLVKEKAELSKKAELEEKQKVLFSYVFAESGESSSRNYDLW